MNNDNIKTTQKGDETCLHPLKAALEVAKYIAREIINNSQNFESIQNIKLAPPIEGLAAWMNKVKNEAPWDHKWQIAGNEKAIQANKVAKTANGTPLNQLSNTKRLASGNLSTSHWHKYGNYDFFYDIWSNVHYGFVGRYLNINEFNLIVGSNIQQTIHNMKNRNFKGGDTPDDEKTIQLGIDLYEEYRKEHNKHLENGSFLDLLTYKLGLYELDFNLINEEMLAQTIIDKISEYNLSEASIINHYKTCFYKQESQEQEKIKQELLEKFNKQSNEEIGYKNE